MPRFLLGYIVILISGLALAAVLERSLGIPAYSVLFGFCGVLFLMVAAGRPQIVWRIVRNTGWFAAVQDERELRRVLVIIGVALLAAAGAWPLLV